MALHQNIIETVLKLGKMKRGVFVELHFPPLLAILIKP